MSSEPGRGRHRCRRVAAGRADAGMVTAELALALPTLLAVMLFGAFLVSAATARIRCIDTAAAVARMVARGEPADAVLARERALDLRAVVTVDRADGLVRVNVSARVPFLVGSGAIRLPAAAVGATLTVADEAGGGPP